jgi:secreted trypsin-like serine protease
VAVAAGLALAWVGLALAGLALVWIGPSVADGEPTAHVSIVGGGSVPIDQFPFQVALYDPHAGSVANGFFCGGVIIDATHVATAAHCAIEETTGEVTPPAKIAVLAGTSHLNGISDPPYGSGAVEDPASATSVDPAYQPSINDYDVAVIRLARPLWSGAAPPLDGHSTIAPIAVSAALAAAHATPASSGPTILATVSGWGDTRAQSPSSQGLHGSYPSNLQAVQVPLVPTPACGSAYGGPLSSQPITSRMLCAGALAGGSDSCFGDSGGPLVVDRGGSGGNPGDYVLAGLVSFGEGCAQRESPGVYAAIADPQIAAFLTSDPPQTPLGQIGSAHARYVYACAHRQRPCRAPSAAPHHPRHPHHHHHQPRPHRRRPSRWAQGAL